MQPTASAYKAREKRFKQRSDAQIRADGDVLDVRNLSTESPVARVGTWRWRGRERPVLAFGALGEAHEGFFVIPDAIDAAEQLHIAHACLTEYVEAPHVTNLHQQNEPVAQIWKEARALHPREPAKAPALSRLHWGAAGFHYDWTARKYYAEAFSPVPPLLARLGAACAECCGETLAAEAVIVNFYKKSSTMGGHQDDVEYTMDHPVVSLSLGSHCVFLKGTLTKENAPLEVLLRSGDLAVLSGKSRLSFHGIAKVLPTAFDIAENEMAALVATQAARGRSNNDDDGEDGAGGREAREAAWRDELQAVRRYLETHRININVRQVYAANHSAQTDNEKEAEADEHCAKRQKTDSQ